MLTINYFLQDIGSFTIYMSNVLKALFTLKLRTSYVYTQVWKVFTQSLLTTSFSGFFVGAIMTIQFSMQLTMFGALGYLGGLSTSGTIREVGPLLIAFMLSGKVGAFTSAELGSMKVSEQMDAIRCLGANPLQEVIIPRIIGIIIAAFFLLVYGVLFSILGGALMSYLFINISWQEYIRHIPTMVGWLSILGGLLKAFSFAVVIALISTFYGYSTQGGAKSVGRSVVKTAVTTMLGIVIMDWFTSLILERIAN